MYRYCSDEYIPLTVEEILSRVNQEDIFSIVEGYSPDLSIYYISPFREDNNPKCYFKYRDETLYFIDWADTKIQRNCFDFIAEYYNFNFYEGLEYINSHFKLNLGYNTSDVKPKIQKKKSIVHNKKTKDLSRIYYKTRNFYDADNIFWNRFDIKRNQLEEDMVYPILWYKFYSEKQNDWIAIRPDDICYAYTDFKDDKVKIYRPYFSKSKFLTNCTGNDIGGINFLPKKGKQLVFSKSYKDYRVLKNYGVTNVWVQSENQFPDEHILCDLGNRFDDFIIFFDNDDPGIKGANKFKEKINGIIPNKSNIVYIDDINIKDPSEYVEKNKEGLKNFLLVNNLITKK